MSSRLMPLIFSGMFMLALSSLIAAMNFAAPSASESVASHTPRSHAELVKLFLCPPRRTLRAHKGQNHGVGQAVGHAVMAAEEWAMACT